jgi:hypothetical protein
VHVCRPVPRQTIAKSASLHACLMSADMYFLKVNGSPN